MAEESAVVQKKGLEDIIAGTSAISFIDGIEGRLIYRGYDIHELVQGSFEEAVYLLLNGALPNQAELEEFTATLLQTLYHIIDAAVRRAVPDRVT